MVESMSERIGMVRENKSGSLMEIIEYNKAVSIKVRFIEHGNVVHTSYNAFIKGSVKNVYERTVYGVGFIGDGEYKTSINNKPTQYYRTWQSMLMRVYDKKYHERQRTYTECIVAEEWLNFQNFAKWYEENYYEVSEEEMCLDKDILLKGNKVYSPDTCVFVPKKINSLFTKCDNSRGALPIGVYYRKDSKKYAVYCNDGKGNGIYLYQHNTVQEAFQVYKTFKEKLIKQIADEYKDYIPLELYNTMYSYTVEIDD